MKRASIAVCVLALLSFSCQNEELVQSAKQAASASELTQTHLTEVREMLETSQKRLAEIDEQLATLAKGLEGLAETRKQIASLIETADGIKLKSDLTATLLETPMVKERMEKAFPDCDNYRDIKVQVPAETSGIEFVNIGVGARIMSLDFACFMDRTGTGGTQPTTAVFLLKTATTVAYVGKDKLAAHLADKKVNPYGFTGWHEFRFRLLVRAMTDEGVVIAADSTDFPVNRVLDSEQVQAELRVPATQMKAVKKVVAEWSYSPVFAF